MLDKEFINLFTEKTVTQLLNEKDLKLLTGLGRKRLSKNIDLLNLTYLFNQEEVLQINHFDLTNINIERVLLDYSDSFVLPDDFRKMLLYLIIYIQVDAYSILVLQESLDVSRNTIITDLKKLNNDLEKVTVQYDRKKGYVLKGTELEIRKYALFYIFTLYKELEPKTILIESCGLSQNYFNDWLEQTYSSIKVSKLDIMTGQVAEIVIFILITSSRNKNSENKLEFLIEPEYLPNQKYLNFSNSYRELFSDQTELNYLSLIFSAISQEELTEDSNIFSQIFIEFLTMFNVISGIDVLNYQALVTRLRLHSLAMMYREKYFIFLNNELIEEIAESNKSLNNVLQEAVSPIEEEIGKPISKTEIGYLIAIIESYLQSKNEQFTLLRAIILCPNGTTSSVLLKKELEELFPAIQFSKASSLSNFKEIDPNEYDIIFSTIGVKTQKYLYIISNFLSNFEKQKLKKEITEQFNLPTLKIPSYKEIENLLSNHETAKQSTGDLYDELVAIITRNSKRQKEWSPVLKELLTEDTIKMNVKATDWEDAIRKGGEILLETGVIQGSYVEAMVKSVKLYGSYIVITPHIALAHASSNDGVNKIGFSLITLKNEIKFNHEENDPVKVVITLAATDQSTHLKALSELMELLGDENFLKIAYDPKAEKQDILTLIQDLKEC
ncbi:BglG family transcription antiterminator [Carnobacterium funditum]|uniref:BglG family transcription antiterminator n=1 Tax=Carnobacterium funditum TaxID=2752 RepID=UPI000551ED68|nr:PTS sugar transporter subunit IIA [Carnobacterium funditum]